jgi:signal transduction histidine kinase
VMSFDFNRIDQWDFYSFDATDQTFINSGVKSPKGISNIGPPSFSSTQPGLLWMVSDIGIIRQGLINKQVSILFQSEISSLGAAQFGIVEDRNGNLFVTGNDGVRKFDPNTGFYISFSGNEGYRPLNYLTPQVLSSGELLISGDGGYVRFNPDEMVDRGTISDIYITEVGIGNEIFSPLYDSLVIPDLTSTNNNISISYIALNYKDPVFTRYRYKIPGYQNEWVEIGRQQQLFFTNFPPGDYVFQLQAATRSQGYSERIAEFAFKVLPPWWKTNIAYFLYAVFIVAGVFAFDRIQRHRIISRERERTREKELQQAREIEKAYKELKATQTQLIHSEKMASLGELTAGIAHEIQNPLNFVNNFSEVSIDLIGELDEEITTGNYEEVKAINQDIKSNLEKINFHGKRASSIVKGMLAHSRTGAGQKELTDINALADEYLRLSYHGLRAKDKSFNARFEAQLDESLPKMKVMGQDIGRVLLNLINNAFYAVSEKYKKGTPGYEPQVWVTTKKLEKHIQIRIKDNGDGIPENIQNKIFQPFFTTKPTGQGTGLGLSLSYDIVTKGHDGSLEVDTQESLGTEFIITLPIINY